MNSMFENLVSECLIKQKNAIEYNYLEKKKIPELVSEVAETTELTMGVVTPALSEAFPLSVKELIAHLQFYKFTKSV